MHISLLRICDIIQIISNTYNYEGRNVRAIIFAGGSATRWRNHLGVPKHLAPFPRNADGDTERLIDRTARQLHEHNVHDINIIAPPNDPRYMIQGGGTTLHPRTLKLSDNGCDVWLRSSSLWSITGRTLVLLGDVRFTDDAMDHITQSYDDWTFFCRLGASALTGCAWGEDFGCSFLPEHHEEWLQALTYVSNLYRKDELDRAGGWEAWQCMGGECSPQIPPVEPPDPRVVYIDDLTDDIDFVEDWRRLTNKIREMNEYD
jgi:hypothetical protein